MRNSHLIIAGKKIMCKSCQFGDVVFMYDLVLLSASVA